MRWILPGLGLAGWVAWLGSTIGAASGGAPRRLAWWSGVALGCTSLAHLAGAWRVRSIGRRAASRSSAGWLLIQEEKNRRKGAWFAGWGVAAALVGWASARLGAVAWLGPSVNLGFQPGLLLAEVAALAAQARLAGTAAMMMLAKVEEGPEVPPEPIRGAGPDRR